MPGTCVVGLQWGDEAKGKIVLFDVPFTTYGVSPTRDGVLLGLSLNTDVADATSIYLKYEGTISGQEIPPFSRMF